MNRVIRKLYDVVIPFFIIMFAAVMIMVSGCGGGGSAGSSPTAVSTPLTDEQKIWQKVEQAPYLQEVDMSGEIQQSDGKSATAVTASRHATGITRTLVDVELLGSGGTNCCAFVDAVFELTGTLTFKDSSGTTVTTKSIDLIAEGTYELVKNTSTGEWEIVADPIDSGLTFTQGGSSAPSLTSFTTTPSTLTAGSTASASAVTSSSDLYVTVQSKSLNFRSQLTSSSSSTYSGSISVASSTAAGKYISVVDLLDKTKSFDLTGDPNFTNPYTGTLKAIKLSVQQPTTTTTTTATYTSLTISCASASLVVGNTTSCSATAAKSDGTSASLAATDVTWALSPSTSGTITVGGILTASVSGTLTVTATFSGLTSNSVTITVSPSTSQTVASYIQAAKDLLFKSNVTTTDFSNAKTNVLNALALDPNNPDANLLAAVIDIATEWDRVVQNVLTPSTSIFPFGGYSAQKQLVTRVLAPVATPLVSALPMAKTYTLSNNPPDTLQTELETNTLPVIQTAIGRLQKVEDYIASNPSYTFTYPKDPAFPELGNNAIDATDVDVLMGAMKLVRGASYYALAYDATTPAGYWNASLNNRIKDTNGDGFALPSEYFPPSPFGTLRSSGSTYLANSKTDVIAGLTLVRDAVNDVLAETTQAAGGITLASNIISDLNKYKHYLDEALTSLSGTTTSVTLAGTVECWNAGPPVTVRYIFDPSYNTGYSCGFTVTNRADLTISVNLAAAFTAVSDLRSFAPTFTQSDTDSVFSDPDASVGGTSAEEKINKNWVFYSLPDDTLNGVFPSGVQKTWFDETTAVRDFSFEIDTSSATTAGCTTIVSSATLAIGGTSFSASSCTVRSNPTGYVIGFKTSTTSVPASADVYTFNAFTGTSAVLTVPGYQPISLMISDNGSKDSPSSTVVPATPARIQSSFYGNPMFLMARSELALEKLFAK